MSNLTWRTKEGAGGGGAGGWSGRGLGLAVRGVVPVPPSRHRSTPPIGASARPNVSCVSSSSFSLANDMTKEFTHAGVSPGIRLCGHVEQKSLPHTVKTLNNPVA